MARAFSQQLTLLSWNVAGRVKRLGDQATLVTGLGTDVVCLQEVRRSTAEPWSGGLRRAGWIAVHAASASAGAGAGAGDRPRPLSVLTAARAPLGEPESIPGLPWPERALATRLGPGGPLIVNLHSPISPSPGLAKVLTHEAVHRYLAGQEGPVLLCGDLNTPRKEHPDGRVWTFARTQHGRLRPERGERWDAAELALIRGLEPHGFRDAFRALHGRERRELSWEWPRWGGGYRLDHLIVSAGVQVLDVRYLHEWRRLGLSDHSPMFARVRW